MPIAKVEPLTTARALRGPFDYRIPRGMEGVGVGSVLVVPFGRRRIHGLVVDVVPTSELPPSASSNRSSASSRACRRSSSSSGCGSRSGTARRPRAGSRSSCPRGPGPPAPRPGRGHGELLEAELTQEGRRALRPDAGPRLGPRQHAALQALAGGPLLVADLTARTQVGHGALKSLASRGLVSVSARPVERRPADVERGGERAPRGRSRSPSPTPSASPSRRSRRRCASGVTSGSCSTA